jgi:hypothetical protein
MKRLMAKKSETTRAHCNICGRENRHIVLASKKTHGSDFAEDYGDISWTDLYEMIECGGCESVSLRHTYWFEPTDETDVKIYPPPVNRRPPAWQSSLPHDVRQILREVYAALAADSRSLAMMGARTVVDMVLLKEVGDIGSFAKKLEAAEKQGLIGKKSRSVLAAALDAGSAAAHRGYRASSEDVSAIMDIVENLLQAVYHLESLANSLKKKTPPRSKPAP